MEFWRITLWRILTFLEGIAILGDLATLWSLDYHALVLVWRVFTLEELGGLWRYTWRGLVEALMMTWMLCYTS